ncbi:hypothetical protein K438DRAFT_1782152 [Mycena galopus ATCC 62051]|nr:hypothetical protein K438DRAFT_1782152 [Mycena galopus ATCC 62051]
MRIPGYPVSEYSGNIRRVWNSMKLITRFPARISPHSFDSPADNQDDICTLSLPAPLGVLLHGRFLHCAGVWIGERAVPATYRTSGGSSSCDLPWSSASLRLKDFASLQALGEIQLMRLRRPSHTSLALPPAFRSPPPHPVLIPLRPRPPWFFHLSTVFSSLSRHLFRPLLAPRLDQDGPFYLTRPSHLFSRSILSTPAPLTPRALPASTTGHNGTSSGSILAVSPHERMCHRFHRSLCPRQPEPERAASRSGISGECNACGQDIKDTLGTAERAYLYAPASISFRKPLLAIGPRHSAALPPSYIHRESIAGRHPNGIKFGTQHIALHKSGRGRLSAADGVWPCFRNGFPRDSSRGRLHGSETVSILLPPRRWCTWAKIHYVQRAATPPWRPRMLFISLPTVGVRGRRRDDSR